MKASVKQVVTREGKECFGHVVLELRPETEEEQELFDKIGDNHAKLCDEESDESIVKIGDCCTSGPIEIDVLFLKPSRGYNLWNGRSRG